MEVTKLLLIAEEYLLQCQFYPDFKAIQECIICFYRRGSFQKMEIGVTVSFNFWPSQKKQFYISSRFRTIQYIRQKHITKEYVLRITYHTRFKHFMPFNSICQRPHYKRQMTQNV